MSLLFKDQSYLLRGACFEIYKDKGSGFLEDVYQECLEIELDLQNIPFVAQPPLSLSYKGRPLRQSYKPDFICYDEIILEIKAAKNIDDTHRAQVHNYLKATNKRLGILVNFGHHPKIQVERIIH
jgi:GxxExxY protein